MYVETSLGGKLRPVTRSCVESFVNLDRLLKRPEICDNRSQNNMKHMRVSQKVKGLLKNTSIANRHLNYVRNFFFFGCVFNQFFTALIFRPWASVSFVTHHNSSGC
jgi:hypothetical protein